MNARNVTIIVTIAPMKYPVICISCLVFSWSPVLIAFHIFSSFVFMLLMVSSWRFSSRVILDSCLHMWNGLPVMLS